MHDKFRFLSYDMKKYFYLYRFARISEPRYGPQKMKLYVLRSTFESNSVFRFVEMPMYVFQLP